jgi:hypothetical protein
MKHDPIPTANASAVTIALIYVVCALAVVLFPSLAMSTAQSWFHGLDLSKIATFNVTPASFIQGLISSTLGTWIVGYFFAKTYNYFAKK